MSSLARTTQPKPGRAPSSRGRASDALLLAGMAMLPVVWVNVWESLGLRFPGCWFLGTTGLPCPTCGSTRALLALGHAEFALAVARNPLLVTAAVFLLLYAGLAMIEEHCGVHFLDPVRRALTARRAMILLGALGTVNWIYLIVVLPR